MQKNILTLISILAVFTLLSMVIFALSSCATAEYETTPEDFCAEITEEYCWAAATCGWENAGTCAIDVQEMTGCWRQENYCGNYEWNAEMADRCLAAMVYKNHSAENVNYCPSWETFPDLPWACKGTNLCQ